MASNETTPGDLIKEFPEPVQETLTQIWAAVPPDKRGEMQGILGQLPGSLHPLKRILDFVRQIPQEAVG